MTVLILGTNLDQAKQYSHLAELERISSFFSTKNVIVHKFYAGDAKWEEVIKVSPRCSFFIYFGHGGMKNFLNMNGFVDSNKIVRELKLKNNAIVLLGHCCFSAGTSSSDDSQISLSTSKKRVNDPLNCNKWRKIAIAQQGPSAHLLGSCFGL